MNCIYSIYIPNSDFDPKMAETRLNDEVRFDAFEKNYNKLLWSKKEYAAGIDCDFHMFEDRKRFEKFSTEFGVSHMSIFDQINFYKLFLMDELSEVYENVLYLDFDVIPKTDENFFEEHKMEEGILVKGRVPKDIIQELHSPQIWLHHTIRSPQTKYWNSHAMLLFDNLPVEDNIVFNTGIVGANRKFLEKLDYFGDFHKDIDLMTEVKEEDLGMYPKELLKLFGYDNETLFAYKIIKNEIPWLNIDDTWHWIFDKDILNPAAKMVHVINKKFEVV